MYLGHINLNIILLRRNVMWIIIILLVSMITLWSTYHSIQLYAIVTLNLRNLYVRLRHTFKNKVRVICEWVFNIAHCVDFGRIYIYTNYIASALIAQYILYCCIERYTNIRVSVYDYLIQGPTQALINLSW
jgi:hypothetical protein